MSEVRRARADEAAALATLWLESRKAAPIPATVHSESDVRRWIAQVLLASCEVWVATERDELVAMLALGEGWVEQLYVAPSHQGQGHGTRLLELAQSEQGELALWTFESNLPARRFYERHGFTRSGPVSEDNEERAAALLYRWKCSV